MKFTKMEGLGNDYVYVNAFTEKVENPGELARRIADRHFGVGGDGLILIEPSDKADAYMHMFNADGSEGSMCGNGIRCVAKYIYDHGIVDKDLCKRRKNGKGYRGYGRSQAGRRTAGEYRGTGHVPSIRGY